MRYFVCFGVFWRFGRKSPSARLGCERSDVTMCVDAHLLHRGLKSVQFDASCV